MGLMHSAFASAVHARPFPIFGRPVRLVDYGPESPRMPLGFSITRDTLPALAASRGRGITPDFGYGAPHPSTSGTLPHLMITLLSPRYGLVCRPAPRLLSLASQFFESLPSLLG